MAERTLQGWELGEAKPSYRNLQRLAAYFGVREEFILAGEGDAPAPPSTTPDLSRDATQLDRIEREVARLHARLDALTPLLPGIAELLGPRPNR